MKHLIPATLLLATAACVGDPPPAPEAPYLAVGTDSAWNLIIDQRDITFIGPGGTQIRQPKPQAIIGVAGEIYQTPRISVNIVHAPCRVAASGRTYGDQVQVDVDGRRYTGCGGH